jgi:hypothetical protein
MAHFAKLDENNNVISVHVVSNDVIAIDGLESEKAGIDFLKELHNHENWKQTSYTASIRANYAAPGYKYDKDFDVFIAPKPYPSWKLDYTTYLWKAPIDKPEDVEGFIWKWSEHNLEWIQVAIPSEG